MDQTRVRSLILVLCLVGFGLSGYLLSVYGQPLTPVLFCDQTHYFSCSTVNQSFYARIAGVPVAALGVVGFAVLGFFAAREQRRALLLLLLGSLIALVFMAYLTLIELFVIKAVCIICILIALITVAIAGGSVYLFRMGWKG